MCLQLWGTTNKAAGHHQYPFPSTTYDEVTKTPHIFFPCPLHKGPHWKSIWGVSAGGRWWILLEIIHPRKKEVLKLHLFFCQCHLIWYVLSDSEMKPTILWEYPLKENYRLKNSSKVSPRWSWLKVNPRNLHCNVLNGFKLNQEVTTSVLYYIKYHRIAELKILPKSLPFLHFPSGKNDWIMNPNIVWVGFYGIFSQSQKSQTFYLK